MQRLGLMTLGMLLSMVAVVSGASGTDTKVAATVQKQVAQHQAEVERLQKAVSQQESASQRAAEKLQQQDRTIAELRRQLEAARQKTGAPAAGH